MGMFDKTHYANGQKVFEFNGNRLTWFFKTGIVKAEGVFENNHMEGEWKFYRESGQLWGTGNFRKSVKEGQWLRYDKSGKLEYDETFSEGKVRKKK